jgi:hypothetical protein
MLVAVVDVDVTALELIDAMHWPTILIVLATLEAMPGVAIPCTFPVILTALALPCDIVFTAEETKPNGHPNTFPVIFNIPALRFSITGED